MNNPRFDGLEVLAAHPSGPARAVPLLFIHGAYAAAWCWEEHFLPFFAAAGFASYAVSLSGHGGSPGREHLDSLGIADYVRDVGKVATALPAPPVLLGHSMGGLVVQKYLEQAVAPAAVLLCSVPPQGLWMSAIGIAFSRPGLLTELNRLLDGSRPHPETLRQAMFAQPIDTDTLMRYYRRLQPESHRAIWDMTLFNLPFPLRVHRPPMLVLGAEHDTLIPTSQTAMTGQAYAVAPHIFPGLGHGLMLERDWELVAQHILDWLTAQGF